MRKAWYQAIAHCQEVGEACALVTVLGAAGSTPREPGAKMVITTNSSYDTVGGGQLEYLIIQFARERIAAGEVGIHMQAFPLAAEARQCCGGHVSVMIEIFASATWNLVVFGAGHVAQQLIPILARMPARVQWFDNRPDFQLSSAQLPDSNNLEVTPLLDPEQTIRQLPANSEVIILTHDHALDFELCRLALARSDIPFVGCIGSNTKAKRFERRLQEAGFNAEDLQRWVCPIGLPEVQGKLPIEVAVSISAQLVARRQLHTQHQHDRRGLAWRELKTALSTSAEIGQNRLQISSAAHEDHNEQ
ncbi:xanthine dehydrogenase accessory protein XdhC [Halioxenophilus sp. WMMB6]|uniref:xanthine dehydrogenase accessory protein XdhC n=1 Tax=Halioxenophilus sp. WMMB6 TaxID=3073815 RepID=UPI00295EB8EE|nr:xanthine dehydrogenase accessory protein XdhC [Halioxenophilus sp. WMMB6]